MISERRVKKLSEIIPNIKEPDITIISSYNKNFKKGGTSLISTFDSAFSCETREDK